MSATLSVCLPNYNHARFLPQALDALLAQSRQPTEIIVLDDASTDDSMAVLERYTARSPNVRLVRNERNLGVVDSLNRLVDEASSEWVLFSAADDFLLPRTLERSMELLEANPEAGLCCGLVRVVDEAGADRGVLGSPVVTDRPRYLSPAEVRRLRPRSAHRWFVVTPTATYRRDLVVDVGRHRPELLSYSDSFMSQVIALRHGACFVPEPLVAFRRMEGTYSANFGKDDRRRQQVYDDVVALMTTEFADVFGAHHAAEWRRQTNVSDRANELVDEHGKALARVAGRGGPVGRGAYQALRVARIGIEAALMVRHGLPLRAWRRERLDMRRIRQGL